MLLVNLMVGQVEEAAQVIRVAQAEQVEQAAFMVVAEGVVELVRLLAQEGRAVLGSASSQRSRKEETMAEKKPRKPRTPKPKDPDKKTGWEDLQRALDKASRGG